MNARGFSLIPLAWILLLLSKVSLAEDPAKTLYVVPNTHGTCSGWLTDFNTERNHTLNNYLDHLDRVRDDAAYAFVWSEVPNLITLNDCAPGRLDELKQRIKEGRVELVNAMFLEPTINLSGGEALVKMGVEGLRWQQQAIGVRPRHVWMIDVTGVHEQMAQIVAGLGLETLVYCRNNPTGSKVHWTVSPDGSRVLTICPGHYITHPWVPVFDTTEPLSEEQLKRLAEDIRRRTNLDDRQLAIRCPDGLPDISFVGGSDYSLAPRRKEYPSELLRQLARVMPDVKVRFATLGDYVDAARPIIESGRVELPTMRGGTSYSYNAFWIENLRIKTSYRRCEHALQAAETLATVASLQGDYQYPVKPLYHAWLMMLLNMDRNILWGAGAGIAFESDQSWDVRDRFELADAITARTGQDAMRALLGKGEAVGVFNPAAWERSDPVLMKLPPGKRIAGADRQEAGDGATLVQCELPSVGVVGMELESAAPIAPKEIKLPKVIETQYYSARIDPASGALVSLKVKPSGREMLGGPANVLVAEAESPEGPLAPGDYLQARDKRKRLADSSQTAPTIRVTSGSVAVTVEVRATFYGGGPSRRVIRFYHRHPRIDFETELTDIPDKTVVLAEFPLAEEIAEVRRGVPYGFSHGAWATPNPELHGWTKGITPAVRWSDYQLVGGGGVAMLDRGLPGRELVGRTPIIYLYSANDNYRGFPCSWLSGKGTHRLHYALLMHEGGWAEARIPQMAWEFNAPPVITPGTGASEARSFVSTSENVVLEVVRREEKHIELRLAECLGKAGQASVTVHLPHRDAALTDLVGQKIMALPGQGTYSFDVRPQQIVTIRFATDQSLAPIEPLVSWESLVPAAKRDGLKRCLPVKGHPPMN